MRLSRKIDCYGAQSCNEINEMRKEGSHLDSEIIKLIYDFEVVALVSCSTVSLKYVIGTQIKINERIGG